MSKSRRNERAADTMKRVTPYKRHQKHLNDFERMYIASNAVSKITL